MSIKDTDAFDPNVFAPNEIEKKYGADDTAWQFLKWNPEYRGAFSELYERKSDPEALEKLFSNIEESSPEMIACAQDITCRERFGIAAWLHPDLDQLPALKTTGDSWFFPLKRVEQQLSAHTLRKQGLSPEKLEWYPWLTVRETPFGYGPVITPGPNLPHPKGKKKKEYEPRLIHVAFDCSIPVEGQLMTLEALARKHREYWNERICSTTTPTAIVESIGWRDIFQADDFVNRDWARTVAIDVLGPVKTQINLCREKLATIYKNLDKESQNRRKGHPGLNEPDMILHFGERFPMPKPPQDCEPAPRGNRYLKALLRIAEELPPDALCPTRIIADYTGLNEQIAEEIGIARKGVTPLPWMEDFAESIRSTHLRRAKNLVNHFYKWLVHDQISLSGDAGKTER